MLLTQIGWRGTRFLSRIISYAPEHNPLAKFVEIHLIFIEKLFQFFFSLRSNQSLPLWCAQKYKEGLEDVATEKEKILALLVATCREDDADDDDDGDDDDDDTMTNRLEDKNLGDRPQYPVAGRPLEPNFQKNFLFEI